MASFGIRIWGARGSLPHLDSGQVRHGGNTVCLELLHDGPDRVILDAGTGLANLGDAILAENDQGGIIHLFISHYHWDHIMGLPFFGPIYRRGFTINLYGLGSDKGHLREMLDFVFSPYYSPIYSPDNLLGNLSIPRFQHCYSINDLKITTQVLPHVHPGGYQVVQVEQGGRKLIYASDVELRKPEAIDSFIDCCRGADLLVSNAAFSQERFEKLVGWGHSSLERTHEVAHRAGVKRLLGIHYDPLRCDGDLEEVWESEKDRYDDLQLELARESEEVWL